MSLDANIRRAAEKWIERYEDDALVQAQLRLDELRALGATEAFDLWLEIYRAAEQLMRINAEN